MSINYAEYVKELVAKGHAAQRVAEGFSQEKVDQLTAAVAYALTQPDVALKYSEDLVKESGMGIAADKQAKMFSKIKGTYYQMKGQKSVGLVEVDEKMGMEKYAKSMGVIGAIIPVTNGEATPVVKSMMALKTRNAIILAPHPKARNTNWEVTEMIRGVLKKFDAPEDLVQAVHPDYVSIETSAEIMKQADFIIATGGTPMVRQAYSSGTPAIGVGTGNVVSIVDGTTKMDDAASLIIKSKIFDNATSCSTENSIIVFEESYDAFVQAMAKQGAHLIKENTDEKQKLLKTIWPESPANHVLNRHIVAQSATDIAKLANIKVADGTKMIMVEENGGYSDEFPFAGEKLSPISALRRAKDFDDAIQQTLNILDYQGKGHSCGIHTNVDERVTKLAELMPVCKVVVNAPQCLTNSGSWTSGLPMSMTLGCGTWGHNSISHNATWKDLLNFTYVSRPIPSYQPKDEDLFDEEIRKAFK
ncbi:MAG: aldehyde dehydrogenase family protein [Eubacteriales bacterium]|nr:aldehyde dehydrogenase family protein [Eubacteriales bacterium]MDD3199469.1 aldehyde dehydrogenase family protein [Eubacteriales bacterium]MDD4121848.1 aldehyde dehydrogenase family protein [Eubacteriales bacterium]MDD4629716.1 aldehyde dehydrogenase family protein [Eubacteriales bacterium]